MALNPSPCSRTPRLVAKPWLTVPRRHCRPRRQRLACVASAGGSEPTRAVVLGAGMAGLCCAQVLSRHFEKVVVLERDVIDSPGQSRPGVVQSRPGVPQFQMPHGLLLQGLRCLNRIFPGFEESLVAAGGVRVDWGLECDFRDFQVTFARGPSQLQTVCATRALFEHVVRHKVLGNPKIALHMGSTATNIKLDDQSAAVAGVQLKSGEAVAAELVVVANGRYSQVGQWLEALGWRQPREMVVDAHVGYATRIYRVPESYSGPKAVLCGTHPGGTRSGLLAPIEGGRWNVILGGYAGDHPPAEEAGFLDFAGSLPAPTLRAAIESAEPLSPITRYRATQNVRKVWEEVQVPEGLCIAGDAVCALNPIYGQGMTVAAMECIALEGLLQQRQLDNSSQSISEALRGFSAEFHRSVAATLEGPWQLAISEDLSFPSTVSNVSVPAQPPEAAAYLQNLALAASRDAAICEKFCTVMHMVDSPAVLFEPGMVESVMQLATAERV